MTYRLPRADTTDGPSPFTKPVRAMSIRRDLNERRWRLVVDGSLDSWHGKLRAARCEASRTDDSYGRALAKERS